MEEEGGSEKYVLVSVFPRSVLASLASLPGTDCGNGSMGSLFIISSREREREANIWPAGGIRDKG